MPKTETTPRQKARATLPSAGGKRCVTPQFPASIIGKSKGKVYFMLTTAAEE